MFAFIDEDIEACSVFSNKIIGIAVRMQIICLAHRHKFTNAILFVSAAGSLLSCRANLTGQSRKRDFFDFCDIARIKPALRPEIRPLCMQYFKLIRLNN